MKKLISATLATIILIAAATLAGCGASPLSDDELKSTAVALIDASAEINEIYFGEGIPCDAPDDYTPGARPQYFNATDDTYPHVEDIKKATAAVYSDEYCGYLFSVAFEGFDTDAGTVFARYIDSDIGTLTVRGGLADEALPLGRVYNYDTIKEVSHTASSVTFTVDTVGANGKDLNVKLTIVQEKNGWRLNNPTY